MKEVDAQLGIGIVFDSPPPLHSHSTTRLRAVCPAVYRTRISRVCGEGTASRSRPCTTADGWVGDAVSYVSPAHPPRLCSRMYSTPLCDVM